MTRSKAAAAAAAAAATAGSIRLRSGSAGHKQLDDEDEDDEHQAIQVRFFSIFLKLVKCCSQNIYAERVRLGHFRWNTGFDLEMWLN